MGSDGEDAPPQVRLLERGVGAPDERSCAWEKEEVDNDELDSVVSSFLDCAVELGLLPPSHAPPTSTHPFIGIALLEGQFVQIKFLLFFLQQYPYS